MRIVAYEDRPGDVIGLKLMALSVLRHWPSAELELTVPGASPELEAWCERRTGLRLRRDRPPLQGYNVKPSLMLRALEEGAGEVLWIDSDVIAAADIRPHVAGLAPEVFALSEECFGPAWSGATACTRGLGLRVGRPIPHHPNSCVVRASRAHRTLLEAWERVLRSPAYLAAQARHHTERPLWFLGDQEVLGALLGAEDFARFPLRWLRRGDHVAQCFAEGGGGYALHERLRNLALAQTPAFLHSMGHRPWRPPGGRRTLHLELSPYTIEARRYAAEVGEPMPWAEPSLPAARLARRVFRNDLRASGLVDALVRELRDQRVLKTLGHRAIFALRGD